MPRIIQVDPALRDKNGHHYNYCLSVAEEARARGVSYLTLCNRYATDRDIETHLNGRGAFASTQDDVPQERGEGIAAAGRLNNEFSESFDRALTSLVEDGDIVLFHALTCGEVLAVADWATRNRHRNVVIGVFVMYPEYLDFPAETPNWRAKFYRVFLRRLAALDQRKLWLVAETTEIADDMAEMSGAALRFEEAPHFKPAGELERIAARPFDPNRAPVRVGYFGYGIPKRGTPLVPGVVERAGSILGPRGAFTIHVNLAGYRYWRDRDPGFPARLAGIAGREGVTVIEGALPPDAFYEAFGSADVVLLPYRDEYQRCGSGQFFESLAAGKLPVVPAGTYMEREIERIGGACVTFESHTEEAAAAAVVQAVERYAELAPRAHEAGLRWQREHHPGAAVERLLERAAALAADAPTA